MFDLNYYNIKNAIRENAEKLNDFNRLKNILNTEDYENLYWDLMVKYKINLELYSTMRKYEMICDAYFKNYDKMYCLKKLIQYTKNAAYHDITE
jgi:hypothetical protein